MIKFQNFAAAFVMVACIAITFSGCRGGGDSFTPFNGVNSRPVSAGSGSVNSPQSYNGGSGTTSAPTSYNGGGSGTTSAPSYGGGSGSR